MLVFNTADKEGDDVPSGRLGNGSAAEDLTVELTQAKYALEAEVRRLKSLVITAATASGAARGVGLNTNDDDRCTNGNNGTVFHGRGRRNSIGGYQFGTIFAASGNGGDGRISNVNTRDEQQGANRRLTMMPGFTSNVVPCHVSSVRLDGVKGIADVDMNVGDEAKTNIGRWEVDIGSHLLFAMSDDDTRIPIESKFRSNASTSHGRAYLSPIEYITTRLK
jgi:hypothetical protein